MYVCIVEAYVRTRATPRTSIDVKRVTVTDFRDKLQSYFRQARENKVVLVESRRQTAKYVVDKRYLDCLIEERESILAALEIFADRELTDRLLTASQSINDDVAAGRLLTTENVFGQ